MTFAPASRSASSESNTCKLNLAASCSALARSRSCTPTISTPGIRRSAWMWNSLMCPAPTRPARKGPDGVGVAVLIRGLLGACQWWGGQHVSGGGGRITVVTPYRLHGDVVHLARGDVVKRPAPAV